MKNNIITSKKNNTQLKKEKHCGVETLHKMGLKICTRFY